MTIGTVPEAPSQAHAAMARHRLALRRLAFGAALCSSSAGGMVLEGVADAVAEFLDPTLAS